METQEKRINSDKKGKFYMVVIDGDDYQFDHSPVTGKELMDIANIPYSTGIMKFNDDGSQTRIFEDDEVELKPGSRLRKRPRFKRG